MCGDNTNKFYELSAVKTNLLISESLMIGGQQTTVKKIMAYKQTWLVKNWVDPMKSFVDRLKSIANIGQPGEEREDAIEYRPAAKQGQLAIQYHDEPEHYHARPTYDRSTSKSDCAKCCIIL